jgi:hypothetical protein
MLQNSFQDSEISLFLLVNTFLGFALNSFEKWLATIFRFSKKYCENSRNVSTNRKKGEERE